MTSQPTLPGIHHITAIASDPQPNIDFYAGLLGLRLVKQTVNFDDPGSYHLYYGDGLGRPGTIMTFFAWPGAPEGRMGTGSVGVTAFAVPPGAADFWRNRLVAAGVQVQELSPRFGERVLQFQDHDGLALELIESASDDRDAWTEGPIAPEHAIRGFHAPTLFLREFGPSVALLTGPMGFHSVGRQGDRERFAAQGEGPGAVVDLVARPDLRGYQAAGTVHHIAWRTPTDAEQLVWQQVLAGAGLHVTDVRDRQYFHSIYYREPGGVLYEIATDEPGFAVDEAPESLGTALKLPPWLEPMRARIQQTLPPIHLPDVVT